MNYAALVLAIEQTIENYESSFIANIPFFVKRAEQIIYNATQMPAVRNTDTVPTVNNVATVAMPEGLLSVNSIACIDDGVYGFLLPKDVEYIREAYPDPTDTGVPKYYALLNDTTFLLGPTPNGVYSLEVQFYGYPESIVTAGDTWLGTNYESALLYGALIEAAVYTKAEKEVMASYTQQFTVALAGVKRLVDGMDRVDTYRNNQFRTKVS